MPSRNKTFSFSDAWIFAALNGVTVDAGGCTLTNLIMHADMLSHAIPTKHEVISALRKLHRYGLVDCVRGLIGVTDHGQEVTENGRRRRGGLFSIAENMCKALNSARIKHPLVDSMIELEFISEQSMSKAYREYHQIVQGKN